MTPRTTTNHTPLSIREREVLQEAANGNGIKQTAEKLTIKLKTVENHRCNIIKKYKVANISEAISIGFRQGIIT